MKWFEHPAFLHLKATFVDVLDLRKDRENELETIETIKQGVEFRGTNLWVLIFATFIASLGLNTNSTAVIIGAMLISPLMGPIMGFGLGIGIHDFDLIKRSFKNFSVATLFSVITSTLFFLISPFSEAQSELLARTQPTIYDVLIAFFGGLAGIVASTSRFKGNVIPGVAIATALMPPLCTAGFGIATGNVYYFLGAFYLYFINSVFISFATFIVVRLMKFPKKVFLDKKREKKVTNYVAFIVMSTIVPSIFLSYSFLKESFFDKNLKEFEINELSFEGTQIISKDVNTKGKEKQVNFIMVGKKIPEESIRLALTKLGNYGLENVKINVQQGLENNVLDMNTIRSVVLEDLYKEREYRLKNQEAIIDSLETSLQHYKEISEYNTLLIPEIKTLFPYVYEISINQSVVMNVDSLRKDTIALVFVKSKSEISFLEKEKMENWLKARTKQEKVRLLWE